MFFDMTFDDILNSNVNMIITSNLRDCKTLNILLSRAFSVQSNSDSNMNINHHIKMCNEYYST